MRAHLTGWGIEIPEKVYTNSDFEKMVDTSDEWIKTRTGIEERRITADDEFTSAIAGRAALKAIAKAGLESADIDLIILATFTPDLMTPNASALVQKEIGAVNAAAFDLSAACTGFIYASTVANQFIRSGFYKNILVIGAETLSKVVEYSDRNTCILFGDGAGAVVFTPGGDDSGFIDAILGADGQSGHHLTCQYLAHPEWDIEQRQGKAGNTIWMNGQEVFKFAVRAMVNASAEVLKKAGMTYDDIDMFIPHQANIRIIQSAARKMKLPESKVYVNLQKYGNTSAAAVPIALIEAIETGIVKKGDNVLMVAFGGGLTWGAAIIKV